MATLPAHGRARKRTPAAPSRKTSASPIRARDRPVADATDPGQPSHALPLEASDVARTRAASHGRETPRRKTSAELPLEAAHPRVVPAPPLAEVIPLDLHRKRREGIPRLNLLERVHALLRAAHTAAETLPSGPELALARVLRSRIQGALDDYDYDLTRLRLSERRPDPERA